MNDTRELNLRELSDDTASQALERALESEPGCDAALWTQDFAASGKLGKSVQ